MKDGRRRQHLRVEQAPPRHQPVEDAAMPVGPVHHWRDREKKIVRFRSFFGHFSYLERFVNFLL